MLHANARRSVRRLQLNSIEFKYIVANTFLTPLTKSSHKVTKWCAWLQTRDVRLVFSSYLLVDDLRHVNILAFRFFNPDQEFKTLEKHTWKEMYDSEIAIDSSSTSSSSSDIVLLQSFCTSDSLVSFSAADDAALSSPVGVGEHAQASCRNAALLGACGRPRLGKAEHDFKKARRHEPSSSPRDATVSVSSGILPRTIRW